MEKLDVNTLELQPVQTEVNEWVLMPDGSLVKTAAKKLHKNMKEGEVTDMLPDSYIFSNDKSMKLKKKDFKDVVIGSELIHYKEGETPKIPKKITFDKYFSKKIETPASLIKNIAKKHKVLTQEEHRYNPFIQQANRWNKQNRAKPVLMTQILNESLKTQNEQAEQIEHGMNESVPQFKRGGSVRKYQSGGDILSGVISGTTAGSVLGPIGAGVGAVLGGVGSLFVGKKQKKEAEKREKERKELIKKIKEYNKKSAMVNNLTTMGKLAIPLPLQKKIDYTDTENRIDQTYNESIRDTEARKHGYMANAQAPSNTIIRSASMLGLSPNQVSALVNNTTAQSINAQNQVNQGLDGQISSLKMGRGTALAGIDKEKAVDSRNVDFANDQMRYNKYSSGINEFGTNVVKDIDNSRNLDMTDYSTKNALASALAKEKNDAYARFQSTLNTAGAGAYNIESWLSRQNQPPISNYGQTIPVGANAGVNAGIQNLWNQPQPSVQPLPNFGGGRFVPNPNGSGYIWVPG